MWEEMPSIALPENANLSIRAAVGGDVTGQSVTFEGGNMISLCMVIVQQILN